MSNTATSSPVMRSRKWKSGAVIPPLASLAKASSSSPSSTNISTVGGWMVAARWSSGGSASASMRVTGMPFLTKASALTAPTGPAPTTSTRSFSRIIRSKAAHYLRPRRPRFRGDDSISYLRNLEHRRMEQLLDGDLALDQTLLVQILGQRGDLAYVLGDAIGPEIFSHERHGLLRFGDQPRQRHHQRVDIEEVGHGQRLGLAERFVDARRQPWIFLHELLADADEVHEREHASLFVVGLFGFARIGEQPFDVRFAAQE